MGLAHERDAFETLVSEHHNELLRVAYLILGDTALSEDAAQRAWVKAWRKIDQLREPDKVRSWLLVVVANEAKQIARSSRSARVDERRPPYAADADPRLIDLGGALAKLTDDERRLLSLRYVAELTSEQIGAGLGVSAGAVRHRLMRLLARLRSELEDA